MVPAHWISQDTTATNRQLLEEILPSSKQVIIGTTWAVFDSGRQPIPQNFKTASCIQRCWSIFQRQ
jgi:hypothetical protein